MLRTFDPVQYRSGVFWRPSFSAVFSVRTDARPIVIASMRFVPCAADFRVLVCCTTWFMLFKLILRSGFAGLLQVCAAVL
ncbi:hypothetical protein [Anaplasma phagocytophilum]|uniref:hypothetical protein n=1 Tax=Anaplasma phagocytophilum TaxID=948 RepID=UPI000A3E4799|nr:hypothetical protein [Anaplasma phagocytophilum]